MDIPIIVVCYNNYKYVENTLKQIKAINQHYYQNIYIMDNCSTCEKTIMFLNNIDVCVIRRDKNNGPWIAGNTNADLYYRLPSKFILTDPDLEFNTNIPSNFIDILAELSDKYQTEMIGFALDISDFDKMFQNDDYTGGKNIYDWESQHWSKPIEDKDYELYDADIDTTFCLVNKRGYLNKKIRVAGNFTAKHLPWYTDNKVCNIFETYMMNYQQTSISSSKRTIDKYIEETFLKVNKKNELFFIRKQNNENILFWQNSFLNWGDETFVIFDKYLDKSKICIDIGAWIGTTALYASRKSKHIYCIEADKQAFNDLSENLKNNCTHNYTLINKAIYHTDNKSVKFGKNMFLGNSKLNDSTSQICSNTENVNANEHYMIEMITLESIIQDYNIPTNEISLIKVDIEGGEENILSQLYSVHIKYNVPLYISFHYDWWNDKNLNRFEFLTEDHKMYIKNNPFGSLVFAT